MWVGLKYERIYVRMQLFDCVRSMRAAGKSNYTSRVPPKFCFVECTNTFLSRYFSKSVLIENDFDFSCLVKLKASTNTVVFRGYLMQVREPGKSAPLGTWIPSNASQTFQCSGNDSTLFQKEAKSCGNYIIYYMLG